MSSHLLSHLLFLLLSSLSHTKFRKRQRLEEANIGLFPEISKYRVCSSPPLLFYPPSKPAHNVLGSGGCGGSKAHPKKKAKANVSSHSPHLPSSPLIPPHPSSLLSSLSLLPSSPPPLHSPSPSPHLFFFFSSCRTM